MITTESVREAPRGNAKINYVDHEEPEQQPSLLSKMAKLLKVDESEVARELGVQQKKTKRPERPLAKCRCGKRYAVQDASCWEEQDVCPACRDELAAPARERVFKREHGALQAQAEASGKEIEAKKQAAKQEDEKRMATLAAMVAKEVMNNK